jgi:dCMP deaminase
MKSIERPSSDDYFMEIASVVAKRSTCLRNQVGALFVRNKRILTTGYNGAPSGLEHCDVVGCAREDVASGTRHELCRAVHAEQNAIIQAALHGISIEGATLYCTHQPCILCAKMMINARVTKVVYQQSYPDGTALDFLRQAGIEVVRVKGRIRSRIKMSR